MNATVHLITSPSCTPLLEVNSPPCVTGTFAVNSEDFLVPSTLALLLYSFEITPSSSIEEYVILYADEIGSLNVKTKPGLPSITFSTTVKFLNSPASVPTPPLAKLSFTTLNESRSGFKPSGDTSLITNLLTFSLL